MDAQTRARYEAWKKNKIRRRIIYPSIRLGVLILLLTVLILTLRNCGRDNNTENAIEFGQGIPKIIPTISEMDPIVYIFNSHPLEMIASTHDNLLVGDMSIVEVSHMLARRFEYHGIPALVEGRCVEAELQRRNWVFEQSFEASRDFVLDAKQSNPSLEFFIDLHRDGIPHRYATVEIDGVNYARILFVIGTDNPQGYSETQHVALEIHALLEEIKPGISRSVFFSGGWGRDGLYGQDITPMLQLIEVGTVDSTVEEMSRTIDILAEAIALYLRGIE